MNFSGNREAPERLSKAIRGLRGVVTLTAAQTNYFMFPARLEWLFICEFTSRSRISANIITNPGSSFELLGYFAQ